MTTSTPLFHPNSFSTQRVLVTGGTRGIGAAISNLFFTLGATVIATYKSSEREANLFLEETLEKKGSSLGHLVIKKCDVTSEEEVKLLFASIEEQFPSLEVLVNNAGIRNDSLLGEMSLEKWNQVLSTNLNGTFLTSRESLKLFLPQKYGRIINIGSIGGNLGLVGQSNYAASKAALIGLTHSLAKEVARKGITVNTVEPGFIETELTSTLSPEQVENYKKLIPLRRFGKSSEVANAVCFVAHPSSSYINDTTIRISGGL